MKIIRILLFLFALPMFSQQGGMWIPSLLEGMNEGEMQTLGMQMTAEDIYSVNQSSLKDAVPHFNHQKVYYSLITTVVTVKFNHILL